MALAQTLQEQLTCPICQDTFTDPMVLKCHHSMCQECLEGLKHASMVRWKVECPVCRNPCNVEEIQRDFRTITLLEAHKKQGGCIQEETGPVEHSVTCNIDGLRLCDLCNQLPVRQQCKECDKMLCQQCTKNHKSIPACQNHNITSLKEQMDKEKATLKQRHTQLKKQQVGVDAKMSQIQEHKQKLEETRERALQDVHQWYESIVQRAARQRDHIQHKINNSVESELSGLEEKERTVSEKQNMVKESVDMIQDIQNEDDPAKVLGTVDSLRVSLDNRSLDDSPHDLAKIIIPAALDIDVHLGKRWDESKALHVKIKKQQTVGKHTDSLPTFPSSLTTTQLVKDKEVKVNKGTKQILIHRGHLWCLYDDRIDVYENGRISRTLVSHIRIPNGMAALPNGNVVVACMSEGLIEFTYRGKYVGTITEGNVCDVSADHKMVYSLDYSDNTPFLKAFKKKQFKWRKVMDREIQNDKCNTFNTILSNQTSIFVSATEENVLIEYNRAGELISRMVGPRATHLCCSDVWGNVILSNYHQNQVWLYKNDQTWHQLGLTDMEKPYSVSVDDEGGVWISNNTDSVTRYTCPVQTL